MDCNLAVFFSLLVFLAVFFLPFRVTTFTTLRMGHAHINMNYSLHQCCNFLLSIHINCYQNHNMKIASIIDSSNRDGWCILYMYGRGCVLLLFNIAIDRSSRKSSNSFPNEIWNLKTINIFKCHLEMLAVWWGAML